MELNLCACSCNPESRINDLIHKIECFIASVVCRVESNLGILLLINAETYSKNCALHMMTYLKMKLVEGTPAKKAKASMSLPEPKIPIASVIFFGGSDVFKYCWRKS